MEFDTQYHQFRETCLKIIANDGDCSKVECDACPFYQHNHLSETPFSCDKDRDLLSSDLLLPACHEWLFHDPFMNFVTYTIRVQYEALEDCCHRDIAKEIEFVTKYAEIMRKILNEWTLDHDKLISKDDLIWLCSEKAHHDVRKD